MPLYRIEFGTSQLEQDLADDAAAVARGLELRETAGGAGREVLVLRQGPEGWQVVRHLPAIDGPPWPDTPRIPPGLLAQRMEATPPEE